MLVRMLPQQIANRWEIIKWSIHESLPPIAGESPDKMNRILENLLSGDMQCWVVASENKVKSILLTAVTEDYCSGTKNLLIYCLVGFGLSDEEWIDGYETLAKFAKSKECSRIIAYSDEPKILEVVERLGGESNYRFISLPI